MSISLRSGVFLCALMLCLVAGLVPSAGAVPYPAEIRLSPAGLASGDRFGGAVAIDDDMAFVASASHNAETGEVWVYRHDATSWRLKTTLTASDAAPGDFFGSDVAMDGDVALVGASQHNGNGAVYVFRWDGTAWIEEDKLVPSDSAFTFRFGARVALDGNLAVIADTSDNQLGFGAGAVWVFRHNGSAWVEEAKLLPDVPEPLQSVHFGWSVAVNNNTLLIGAWGDNDAGYDAGAAYVFGWNGTGWQRVEKLTALDADGGDQFGLSAALQGRLAVIGAPRGNGVEVDTGVVYLFYWNGISWAQIRTLTASDGETFDGFGSSVSISGNSILVGAEHDDDDGQGAGAAYLLQWNGLDWDEKVKLLASDGSAGSIFGSGAAISGNFALVGANAKDDNLLGEGVGAAYLFNLDPGDVPDIGLSERALRTFIAAGGVGTQSLTISNRGSLPLFWNMTSSQAWLIPLPGSGVVPAGGSVDITLFIDGRELSDGVFEAVVAVGSNDPDEPLLVLPLLTGALYTPREKWLANDGTSFDIFGGAVAVDGAVAMVGAYQYGQDPYLAGAVYVFDQVDKQWLQSDTLTASDAEREDDFGRSLALAGDVAIVGAPAKNEGGSDVGAAYVFRRQGTMWLEEAKLTAEDGVTGDRFGQVLAISGDLAVLGVPYHENPDGNRGAAYLFRRNGMDWQQEVKLSAEGGSFGFSVAIEGGVVAIGAINASRGGAVYVFEWNGTDWEQTSKVTPILEGVGDQFGSALDLDDGVLVVGARFEDSVGSTSGATYAFRWNGVNWQQEAKLKVAGRNYLGYSVAVFDNVIVSGAPADADDQGAAYWFYWNGTAWVPRNKLIAVGDRELDDQFGYSVSVNDTIALIGVPFDDDLGDASGSVYVFDLPLSPIPVVRSGLTALSPDIEIAAEGGLFLYRLSLTNTSEVAQSVQFWSDLTLPNGAPAGPVWGPQDVTLGAGESLTRWLVQWVPGSLPSGSYGFVLKTGSFPGTVISRAVLSFTKLGVATADFDPDVVTLDAWTAFDTQSGREYKNK